MPEQKFRTIILAGEMKNVAGIEVPSDVIGALNAGQRPRVSINVNGYDFVSTIGKMGGKHLIPLNAEHRKFPGCREETLSTSVFPSQPTNRHWPCPTT